MTQLKIEYVPIDQLKPFEGNPRKNDESVDAVIKSIEAFGYTNPILARRANNEIIAGHTRVKALLKMGKKQAPVIFLELNETDARVYSVFDNKSVENAEWDFPKLADLLVDFDQLDVDLDLTGFSLDEIEDIAPETFGPPQDLTAEQARKKLTEQFIVPPFSVLDARQGYWQERKRQWIALGIKSEIGRVMCEDSGNYRKEYGAYDPNFTDKEKVASFKNQSRLSALQKLSPGGSPRPACDYRKQQRGDGGGKPLSCAKDFGTEGNASEQTGTSIFDPVLCEIIYRWFCPTDGAILDPFAGGSVRGIIAQSLGYDYTGIELRAEQVRANEKQAEKIIADSQPHWVHGDSAEITTLADSKPCDLIFSCPPYYNLEVYSEIEGELSAAASYDVFIEAYRGIIKQCVDLLKDNRFACFVVGDIRDKRGFYRNFVSDTIAAFQDSGTTLYNEAILVTAIGSLPVRIGRQFQSGRKLGKTHQNVLIFYKGEPKKIKGIYGEVQCGDTHPKTD